MKLEDHVYEWDNIVIGGDLRSLVFAAANNYPVIFVDPNPPFRFNTLGSDIGLSKIGFYNKNITYELEAWERMFFIIGLAGLCPLSSKTQSIRIKDNVLVITTKNFRVIKAKFNKLIVFEDRQLKTLPEVIAEEQQKNKVIDWFNVRYGCKHKWDCLSGNDNFINRIYFYPTDRSDNKKLKDAVAVSYLSDEQVRDLDYSEFMARFKVEHIMREAGVKGPINGYNNRKAIHLGIKVEHAEREIIPCIKRFYKPDSRYEFRYDSLKDVFERAEFPGYVNKLIGVA